MEVETNKEQDKYRRTEQRRFTAYIVSGLAVSLLLVTLFSYAITLITAKMTYDATLEVKKSMLKENVENMVSYLDACSKAYLAENPGADDEQLEKAMYDIAYRKIYSETHVDGTYMWVQKVLDYNGGDGYAVRLIHPNLSDTEGELLSTNTVNPSGIKAYEEELEGVKKNGSVYLSYDFKKLSSDEVTSKVTYSRLYEPFDWIICMGVNIDDLEHYQEQARENMRTSQALILAAISLTWLVLLYLMFHSYRKTSGRLFEKKQKELSQKLDWDTVTGANSRAYGEKLLEREYEMSRFGSDTMIVMLDVDNFKLFNDNFGHDIGDKVLREFVEAVKGVLRDGDSIIRWGGDEFIAVLHKVEHSYAPNLGERITNAVRSISIPELEGKVKTTTSAGLAFFDMSDTSSKDVIERADKAVYEAKEAGRDCFRVNKSINGEVDGE